MTMMQLYKVTADPETGEWLSAPEHIGEIDSATHRAREDTDEVHYDEVDPEAHQGFGDGTANVALEVHWKS